MNVALHPERCDILSLCTGGGGLDLGVELAIPGARSVCMVEREAFAVAQLVSAMEAGLMAQASIWSDARTFDGRPWRGLVDGLIGGIPCQPHSLAGKRLGEEDERDLWSDARRILVQSGAWFVIIENVRGMLSSGGAERVWRDLHRMGFSVEGGLFTAAEVGASHERERLFILGVADRQRGRWNEGCGSETAGQRKAQFDAADSGSALADASGAGSQGSEQRGSSGKRYGARSTWTSCRTSWRIYGQRPERQMGRRGRWQKSGDSPAVETLTGQSLDVSTYLDRNIWPTPTAMNRPRSEETLERCRAVRKARAGQNTVPLYLEDLVSRLSLPAPETFGDGAPSSKERRSLNPLFVEWLMGWPPGWTLLAWTDFACSATVLCLWRQHMRCALSQLALPDEAPPAQLALFG